MVLFKGDLFGRVFRRFRDEFFPHPHPFDMDKGIDTSGRVSLRRLGISSPNRKHGSLYQGVEPSRFAEAMAEIQQEFANFTFIDLGAGKGRALLMAKQYHFARLVGVEFSAKLASIARTNLAKLKVGNVEILVQDAAEFSFPPDPLVVFMFNSFGSEILERVLLNLRSHPGPLYLVYVNPLHDSTIREDRSFRPLVTGMLHSVWCR